ncbi:bifunctional proline dehydrogenase/L-glutamate gamma-semialdehyde dehydrogenase [Frigoribacterium sp. CG_9.8]|uniref:bifunctional proline dehydrogenase/L-glutamate gamma-semialdehyde dehydrogenase n=1 Tax=Frigoribacterium sp. CG_9.8 TaxID=2787733 RepID=UPI0018CB6928|nr:bifunctional proline dehydrogenase/L-glutamate gamma-semialdehyde dehydrogenase [Frigoribacterium sp. CG_9.8]MBG6108749.1 RHH-type proline utilization regulon transcriptional repressor/proline dehydrogenase/delta 1-pyrroline-5-carboxylate dehydrogenase [Frigoribacterium sp. CG_9.8]
MLSTAADLPASPDLLAAEAVATVRRWLVESADVASDRSAGRLAALLRDPRGLAFIIGLLDRVVRPEDLRVAGRNCEQLSRAIPASLPWYLRAAIQLAGGFAPLFPWPIVPLTRWVLRGIVSHLMLDASPRQLDRSIRARRRPGIRLNLSMLGEAVLGDDQADRQFAGTRELLQRDDVDCVSLTVSAVTSQLSMWSFDEAVDRAVMRLTPLYEWAAASPTSKFITLDLEKSRDFEFTIEVFRRILEQPQLKDLEAGIVIQASLPDALRAMQGLTAWASQRRAQGGAGITVRVVTGANLAMERVDATLHGWPLATWGTKRDTDANYKRILDWSFVPTRTDAVRISVASHNLFDIAWAWLLAKQRRVETRVEFESTLGIATGLSDAVTRDTGGLLLYAPVVRTGEFGSATPHLIRLLEQNVAPENFLSGVFDLALDAGIFDREAGRFLDSLDGHWDEVPEPHRVQDRRQPVPIAAVDTAPRAFVNEPDTDPSIAGNREWGRQILSRVATSTLGDTGVAAARITGLPALEAVITATARAGESWGQRRSDTRATVLHSAGEALAAARADLIEVMASETGKTFPEGDGEVSEAIDFANYYAECARELDRVADAEFQPSKLIVVVPPGNSPVAIAAGSVLAALASGAGVIISPAPQARRSAAVLVEALWAGGVPRDVLSLVDLDEGDLSRELIAHPSVDRVILTGAWETAKLFRSWRPDLPLLAATSGKNAIIVTQSADLDLAAADVVMSAFGHAGQECSAASLVILVGSVAASERFRRQLIDSVSTLRVGYPQEATTVVGPIIEPPPGALRAALTTLSEGESWLVQPRSLDESDRLWSPGLRDGVTAGSEFHLTEVFGPVLGIMRADTLEQAIALQNAPDYGLTAGIHSLDAAEIALWVATAQAGNLYINRSITGTVVRRQPFGGWKRSTVGGSAKAGGPNFLLTLGDWRPVFAEPGRTVVLDGLSEKVARVIEAAQQGMEFLEFDRVRAGAESDQRAWITEYGMVRDASDLDVERNVLRYRSVPVTVRLAEGASPAQLVRTIAAATRAGAPLSISSAVPVASRLLRLLNSALQPVAIESVVVETDARWHARVQSGARPSRIRLLGGDRLALATVLDGDPDVAIYAGPVTTSGRIELLPFLREQAISMTAHRFGAPDPSLGDPLRH